MSQSLHILFAGGGSLGNVYPGLTVAEHLSERLPGATITFVGDGRPIERHTVTGAGRRYLAIPGKQRPRRVTDALRFVTDNTAGYCAARWVLKEQRVSLVVGMGGHACPAVLRAASDVGVPIVLIEPDAVPAFSTRWLAAKAESICLAFEEALPHLGVGAPAIVTGVPGRPGIERFTRGNRQLGNNRPRRLVVLGGEGGASSLNESMPVALSRTSLTRTGWSVVHQTGEGQLIETIERYRRVGVDAVVVTYIDELADILRETDLVVCRSSGCTIAELARAGVPAVLAPDARSDRGSQTDNARIVSRGGGFRVVDELKGDLAETLSGLLTDLTQDESRLRTMASRVAVLDRPEAGREIAHACLGALGVEEALGPRVLAAA